MENSSKYRYQFNKKVGNYNEVKLVLLEMLQDNGIADVGTRSESNTVNFMLYHALKMIFMLNRHHNKMLWFTLFKVLDILCYLISQNKECVKFQKLNKKKLAPLSTDKLATQMR